MCESFDACTYHRYNYRFFCQRIPLHHIRRPDINNETWFIAISKAFVSQTFLRSAICDFFLIFINKYINTFVTKLHSLTIMNKFQNSLQNNNVKKSGSFTRKMEWPTAIETSDTGSKTFSYLCKGFKHQYSQE